MTSWRMVGIDRFRAVTIAYARVAWFAVIVTHWHTDDIPAAELEAGLRKFTEEMKARPPRPAAGRVLLNRRLDPTPDLHISVCVWREARWTA